MIFYHIISILKYRGTLFLHKTISTQRSRYLFCTPMIFQFFMFLQIYRNIFKQFEWKWIEKSHLLTSHMPTTCIISYQLIQRHNVQSETTIQTKKTHVRLMLAGKLKTVLYWWWLFHHVKWDQNVRSADGGKRITFKR